MRYDVVFDDGDGRERVKREELRSVFVPGAFDWASPFVEEDEEVEEEASVASRLGSFGRVFVNFDCYSRLSMLFCLICLW